VQKEGDERTDSELMVNGQLGLASNATRTFTVAQELQHKNFVDPANFLHVVGAAAASLSLAQTVSLSVVLTVVGSIEHELQRSPSAVAQSRQLETLHCRTTWLTSARLVCHQTAILEP